MNPFNLDVSLKDIKLNINGGILTLINETIISSISDFNGILIGKYKLKQQTQSIDSNANHVINTLHLIIDDVIFIFDKHYLNKRLDCLIQKVHSKYSDSVIIGLCSGKSYSFPKISLNEQELYIKLLKLLRANSNSNVNPYLSVPLLFGAFAHNNSTNGSDKNSIKHINFQSKIYYYDYKNNSFSPVSFSIVNIKDTTYSNIIDPISNKIVTKQSYGINKDKNEEEKKEKNDLKEILDNQLEGIEAIQLKQIKDLKCLLKNEIKEYVILNNQLKSFNK